MSLNLFRQTDVKGVDAGLPLKVKVNAAEESAHCIECLYQGP